MSGLVAKFKSWLSNDVKVDYNAIAVDVRGLAEHVEKEFTDINIELRAEIKRVEAKLDAAIKVNAPIPLPHPATVTPEMPTQAPPPTTPAPIGGVSSVSAGSASGQA